MAADLTSIVCNRREAVMASAATLAGLLSFGLTSGCVHGMDAQNPPVPPNRENEIKEGIINNINPVYLSQFEKLYRGLNYEDLCWLASSRPIKDVNEMDFNKKRFRIIQTKTPLNNNNAVNEITNSLGGQVYEIISADTLIAGGISDNQLAEISDFNRGCNLLPIYLVKKRLLEKYPQGDQRVDITLGFFRGYDNKEERDKIYDQIRKLGLKVAEDKDKNPRISANRKNIVWIGWIDGINSIDAYDK